MQQERLRMGEIPAVLWGPAADTLYIAVHGDGSHKEDDVIAIFAEEAVGRGHQVLSLDLPEHGERKESARTCDARNCAEDLAAALAFARGRSSSIGLFGCSLGAYFGMLAYGGEAIRQALFLSPVVDMKRLIENMMVWFGVSEERLKAEGRVATPMKTLDWDYYRYVADHPISWDKPTALLRGGKDTLCEPEVVRDFAARTGAQVTVLEDGEHFFHTGEQLAAFRVWLGENILP